MPNCRVCASPNVGTHPLVDGTVVYDCARCGHYAVTVEAMQSLPNLKGSDRPKFSRWIRDQNRLGTAPTIREADFQFILGIPALAFAAKADRLLEFLAGHIPMLGERLDLSNQPELHARTETFTPQELAVIVEHLRKRNLVEGPTVGTLFVGVTGDGLERVEQLRAVAINSEQGFVAMWFNDDLKVAWDDGFTKGIQAAGYQPLRIDGKEHNHKICDEIVAEIRRSRFVVADFTGHRGGVYYEAGFAAGLGVPVVFTCRKDGLKDLHFDVRQFNTIDWTDAGDLAARLEARICATIGDGPNRH
jgi:nucleoside 2-deoxyribosyltransferase